MSSQTHTKRIRKSETKKSLTKNRKVSKKKTLYKGGDNTENYENLFENINNTHVNNGDDHKIFYEQAGGGFEEIKNYKLGLPQQLAYRRRSAFNTTLYQSADLMITFEEKFNLQKSNPSGTVVACSSALFCGPNAFFYIPSGTPLNTAYNPNNISKNTDKITVYNDVNVNPPDKPKKLPDKEAFGITGKDENNNLSAGLMSNLIQEGIIDKIDNIYLNNPENNSYENDSLGRYNVIVLPFAIINQEKKSVRNVGNISKQENLCLLSHYIGNGTKVSNKAFFNTQIDIDNKIPKEVGTKHIAWRPFFCNYNSAEKKISHFINYEKIGHQAKVKKTISDNPVQVNKNIFYHVLSQATNPSANSGSLLDYSSLVNVEKPENKTEAEKYKSSPEGKAISVEIFNTPNSSSYNDLKKELQGNLIFPFNKKIMVISFLVNVDITVSHFPVVEYEDKGEYVFANGESRPEDGQVAWVPIAKIEKNGRCIKLNSSVKEPAPAPAPASAQDNAPAKVSKSHTVHNDAPGSHKCNPHTNGPLKDLNACIGMETPYEWFYNLVNMDTNSSDPSSDKLPKILKESDGFKILMSSTDSTA